MESINPNLGLKMNCSTIRSENCYLLYDPMLLSILQRQTVTADFLNTGFLQNLKHFQRITTGGRGRAWFVEIGELLAVYRQYQRGGLMARINQDIYVTTQAEKSRSFKEWRLLQQMLSLGLPVPQPIAASVCYWPFKISPFYRAQILIRRIPNVETLDQILGQRPLTEQEWRNTGKTIRLFHNTGIYHADLNANNILLNESAQVYLIDFDKGEYRHGAQPSSPWMQNNLKRLKRSLLKQQDKHNQYHFSENDWQVLVAGYDGR